MATETKHTPGPWNYACDSYGRVRHSKKASVFVRGSGVKVAAQIANWDDARLIAAAPDLLDALKRVQAMRPQMGLDGKDWDEALGFVAAAIAKAEGT